MQNMFTLHRLGFGSASELGHPIATVPHFWDGYSYPDRDPSPSPAIHNTFICHKASLCNALHSVNVITNTLIGRLVQNEGNLVEEQRMAAEGDSEVRFAGSRWSWVPNWCQMVLHE